MGSSKILICGDRNLNENDTNMINIIKKQLEKCYKQGYTYIIHGNCTGVDKISAKLASEIGYKEENIIKYPADWSQYGKKAGPIRNKQMLEENPEFILAFHSQIQKSKGTKDMIKQALKSGKIVWLFNGKTEKGFTSLREFETYIKK